MKRNVGYLLRCALLAACCLLAVLLATWRTVPEYYHDSEWSTTATYEGFYAIPEDSVDVIFVGSSAGAAGIVPQALYDEYGITSYNLCCEQQNLLVSYYWLREALTRQSPKAVVLDTYMLHPYFPDEPINTSEGCTRKAIDPMRMGAAKLAAIRDICTLDAEQSALSYLLPFIRFHSRWSMMEESDYHPEAEATRLALKGYVPWLTHWTSERPFAPYEPDAAAGEAELVPVMVDYAQRIAGLCRERGIALILTKMTNGRATPAMHNAVAAFAAANDLPFIDFNERAHYEAAGIEYMADMAGGDDAHHNLTGALKATAYLGGMLAGEYGIAPRSEDAWEKTRGAVQQWQNRMALAETTDAGAYLAMLKDERYTVFAAVTGDIAQGMTPEFAQGMRALGLEFAIEGWEGAAYAAIRSPEGVIEQASGDAVVLKGVLREGAMIYELVSTGAAGGSFAKIEVDGQERALGWPGLSVVVYDEATRSFADSVNIAADGGAMRMSRRRAGEEK